MSRSGRVEAGEAMTNDALRERVARRLYQAMCEAFCGYVEDMPDDEPIGGDVRVDGTIDFEKLADQVLAVYNTEAPKPSLRCVVDDCSYEPADYDDLNKHSGLCHLQPNPFKYGAEYRYPGVDRAGDFMWHVVAE